MSFTFQAFCERNKLTSELLADRSFVLTIDMDDSVLPMDYFSMKSAVCLHIYVAFLPKK